MAVKRKLTQLEIYKRRVEELERNKSAFPDPYLAFVTVSLGAIWAAFYTFHLFPLGEDLEWWNIPHMLTAAAFMWVLLAGQGTSLALIFGD